MRGKEKEVFFKRAIVRKCKGDIKKERTKS
jgi:hypothetical protein